MAGLESQLTNEDKSSPDIKEITLWYIYISSKLSGSRARLHGCGIGAPFLQRFLIQHQLLAEFWGVSDFLGSFCSGFGQHSGLRWDVMDWQRMVEIPGRRQSQMEFKVAKHSLLGDICHSIVWNILPRFLRRTNCIFGTQSVSWLINYLISHSS